jgi:hypothetical protein
MMNRFGKNRAFKRPRIRRPTENTRRRMLDMRREREFRFDLDDLFSEFHLGENKNTIAATILNKMTIHSMDDTMDYVNRLRSAETLNGENVDRLMVLLQRYSKLR